MSAADIRHIMDILSSTDTLPDHMRGVFVFFFKLFLSEEWFEVTLSDLDKVVPKARSLLTA